MDLIGDGKRCEDVCKYAPPQKGKWPCEDCDMRFHDRAEPPERRRPMKYIKLDDAIQTARPEGLNENRDDKELAVYAKGWNACIHTYVANLCELPAANVREVVRGHYDKFRTPFTAVCSECGRSLDITWNFCPQCGAVM